MVEDKKYNKLINALKSSTPVLTDKKRLTDNIMRKIQETPEKLSLQEKLDNLLFGWVNSFGLRLAMATVTIFLVGFFIIQQIIIQDRLSSLEKQLVRTVNTINGQDPEPGILQKVFIKMALKEQLREDSITISRDDMDELLNNYRDLLENYENIKRRFGHEPLIEGKIKQNSGEIKKENMSEL